MTLTDSKPSLWALQTNDTTSVTFKFKPQTEGQKLSKSSQTYESPQKAQFSPIGQKIFGFPWVEKLEITPDTISITHQDWVELDIIKDPLLELLTEHTQALIESKRELEENPVDLSKASEPEPGTASKDNFWNQLNQFITQNINPQLAEHGGAMEAVKFEKGELFISLGGGCQGCGMATQTLNEGIEKSLKEHFPSIEKVVDLTDHSSGLNPYSA